MNKNFFLGLYLCLILLVLSSCNSSYGDVNDNLNTVPVTNNPKIVPDSASPIPGMPSRTL